MSPNVTRSAATNRGLLAGFVLLIFLASSHPIYPEFNLDPTFGLGNGSVTIAFPDSSTNYSAEGLRIFLQLSGRIVAGGMFTNQGSTGQLPGVAFVGLTATGGLDTTYGTSGATVDWTPTALTSFFDAYMYPDGRVLRIAKVLTLSGTGPQLVVRLNANGSVDNTFSASIGSNNAIPLQVSVRSDGKILILVYGDNASDGVYDLYRLNPDGSRDTTFGTNGNFQLNLRRAPAPSFEMYMETLPDGRILIAGNLNPAAAFNHDEFFLLRISSDGHIDKSFGRQGLLRRAFGGGLTGAVKSMLVQPDGKILLAGGISIITTERNVWMARFTPNGKPDGSFGNAGVVISNLASGRFDEAAAVILSADGKIRIAGGAGSPRDIFVARYSAAGTYEAGIARPLTGGHDSGVNDLIFQPDGKILVIGYTKNPNSAISGNVFAVARFFE